MEAAGSRIRCERKWVLAVEDPKRAVIKWRDLQCKMCYTLRHSDGLEELQISKQKSPHILLLQINAVAFWRLSLSHIQAHMNTHAKWSYHTRRVVWHFAFFHFTLHCGIFVLSGSVGLHHRPVSSVLWMFSAAVNQVNGL